LPTFIGSMRDLVPILSCRESVEYEKVLLPTEDAVWKAMSAAGEALARAVLQDFLWWKAWPNQPHILVLAGKGNNAGDALIAAASLATHLENVNVTVLPVWGERSFKTHARRAFSLLTKKLNDRLHVVEPTESVFRPPSGKGFTVTLDGMLGAQFAPPVRAPGDAVIRWSRTFSEVLGFRVAVDLPSGIGDRSAEESFPADVTYGTGIIKAPVLDPRLIAQCGRVRFLDLGFFDQLNGELSGPQFATEELLRPLARLRPADSDKRNFGKIFVVGGSGHYPGAVLMAAQAAARAGGGLITAMVAQSLFPGLAVGAPEVMWGALPVDVEGGFLPEAVDIVCQRAGDEGVILVGPGLQVNPANSRFVQRLLRESELPMVLDAGALRLEIIECISERSASAGPVILTPHQGEFNRLARRSGGGVPDAELMDFAAHYRAITVLKGPVTRVSEGKRVVHVAAGNPVLARGGSGDILAGMLAARLAVQPQDGMRAALEAVVWHGRAADALARSRGETGVRTTELLDHLAPALRGMEA